MIKYNSPLIYNFVGLGYNETSTIYNSNLAYNNPYIVYGGEGLYVALFGRPLTYHLNRLAGTLTNDLPQLPAQGAANTWAGTSGLALVGALNFVYASRNAGKNFHYDIQGALNALAGTTGLGIDQAASEIVA